MLSFSITEGVAATFVELANILAFCLANLEIARLGCIFMCLSLFCYNKH